MMKRMTECWKDRTRFVCVHRGWSGEEKGTLFMQTSYNFSIIKLSLLEISYLVMSSVVHIIWVSGMRIGMYF